MPIYPYKYISSLFGSYSLPHPFELVINLADFLPNISIDLIGIASLPLSVFKLGPDIGKVFSNVVFDNQESVSIVRLSLYVSSEVQ